VDVPETERLRRERARAEGSADPPDDVV